MGRLYHSMSLKFAALAIGEFRLTLSLVPISTLRALVRTNSPRRRALECPTFVPSALVWRSRPPRRGWTLHHTFSRSPCRQKSVRVLLRLSHTHTQGENRSTDPPDLPVDREKKRAQKNKLVDLISSFFKQKSCSRVISPAGRRKRKKKEPPWN